ncbi:MAG: CarD family transcriptional regulator [Candidatus Dadabacteria bacterium]|nr:MAG: CarD family transcriptional regulator [Candidatus Dadabacteria bacterium]
MAFKVGDTVVYPGHGVGKVSAVESKKIGSAKLQFLDITIIDTGMKIMVPVSQAKSVGLRAVMSKQALKKVYSILKSKHKVDTQTWNRRFREYTEKIKTGSVYEIAEVVRDLCCLGKEKDLSFGEKQMLDIAQGLLASEIAVVKASSPDKVMGEIRSLCGLE